MGLVRMGPPTKLILHLKMKFGLKDFIETGTYYGNTAVWAASYFDNVITIEYSREIYEETIARYDKLLPNINFIFGDSRSVLKTIVPNLGSPAIFWLDSHWSGGLTYGSNDECPLIEELRAISTSTLTHFIFIDDARLFASPPPRPHQLQRWPSITTVIKELMSISHEYYIVIIEDVIIAVPNYAKELVISYCQEVNTKAWEEYGKHLNEGSIKQGWRLIGEGLKLIGYSFYHRSKNLTYDFIKKAKLQ